MMWPMGFLDFFLMHRKYINLYCYFLVLYYYRLLKYCTQYWWQSIILIFIITKSSLISVRYCKYQRLCVRHCVLRLLCVRHCTRVVVCKLFWRCLLTDNIFKLNHYLYFMHIIKYSHFCLCQVYKKAFTWGCVVWCTWTGVPNIVDKCI